MAVGWGHDRHRRKKAAMEPGLGDREWGGERRDATRRAGAAMEPGLGDREWEDIAWSIFEARRPQWSPILETGNGLHDVPTQAQA